MQPQNRMFSMNRKTTGRLLLTIFIICAVVVGYLLYWSAQFRIVDTTPSMDNFPAGSPVLIINFSQPLAQTLLTTSWNPNVNSIYTIHGQRLTLNIQSILEIGKKYHITISGVKNQQGKPFGDISYTFTTQDISYNDMPSDVQQALLQRQDQYQPPSRNTLTFSGTDALLAQGLSDAQLQAVKQAVFLFGQSQKKTFSTVAIDPSSVRSTPHDPESTSTNFGMTCTMTINSTPYAATIIYHDFSIARLTLSSPGTNVQAYDSGDIDTSTL